MSGERRTTAALAVLALVLVAAGCGGGSAPGPGGAMTETGSAMSGGGMMSGGGPMMGGSPTTSSGAPGEAPGGGTAQGRALFVSSGCGGCHTLAAAGTTGTAGPNLDEARPGYALVVERVRDGAGAMPSFAGSLSDAQIRAIARYVAGAAR